MRITIERDDGRVHVFENDDVEKAFDQLVGLLTEEDMSEPVSRSRGFDYPWQLENDSDV